MATSDAAASLLYLSRRPPLHPSSPSPVSDMEKATTVPTIIPGVGGQTVVRDWSSVADGAAAPVTTSPSQQTVAVNGTVPKRRRVGTDTDDDDDSGDETSVAATPPKRRHKSEHHILFQRRDFSAFPSAGNTRLRGILKHIITGPCDVIVTSVGNVIVTVYSAADRQCVMLLDDIGGVRVVAREAHLSDFDKVDDDVGDTTTDDDDDDSGRDPSYDTPSSEDDDSDSLDDVDSSTDCGE